MGKRTELGLVSRWSFLFGAFFGIRGADLVERTLIDPRVAVARIVAAAGFELLQEAYHTRPPEFSAEGFQAPAADFFKRRAHGRFPLANPGGSPPARLTRCGGALPAGTTDRRNSRTRRPPALPRRRHEPRQRA